MSWKARKGETETEVMKANQGHKAEDGVRNMNINQGILATAFDDHEAVDG